MTWPLVQLRHICRFAYGESLPSEVRSNGQVSVYGSNGPTGTHDIVNTSAPVIIIGRKGSHGKLQFSRSPVFAIDTTYFVDPSLTSADPRWLHYALSTLRLDELTTDVGVPGLNREKAYERRVPLPRLGEQRAIADFLDRETARIDALVVKKKSLQTAVANRYRVVAESLIYGDTSVPRVPLRHVARFLDYRGRTPRKLGMEWGGGDIPAISAMNVELGRINLEKETNFGSEALFQRWMVAGKVSKGDVLITTEAPLGNVAEVPDEHRYILSQRVLLMKPARGKIRGDFLAATLSCPSFQRALQANSTGSTALGIKVDRLRSLKLPVPSLETQVTIASRLKKIRSQEGAVLAKLSAQTYLLQEHRQALITAAVNGQMEIPSTA